MKTKILTILSLLPATVFAQSGTFTIKGKITGAKVPSKAFLSYRLDNKVITDSATVNQGAFSFTGHLTDPVKAQLVFDHDGGGLTKLGRKSDIKMLFIEKGNISITSKDSVKNAVITGSRLNDDNKKYQELTRDADKQIAALNEEYEAASPDKKQDKAFNEGLQARYDKIIEGKYIVQNQFIKQHPDSYLGLVFLMEQSQHDIDVPKVEPVYKSLSADVRNTGAGLAFAKSINAARATSIGAMAPVFTQNDVNDKPVNLTDFHGKYVLLDFWASWCGPCRGENPNVVKAYNMYKSKNFTVMGVSLDRPGRKDDWLEAIKADGLVWTQVSDLSFWNNAAAKLYGVTAIPQNYLIDPNGRIIAKNLRGDELNKKLAELLK